MSWNQTNGRVYFRSVLYVIHIFRVNISVFHEQYYLMRVTPYLLVCNGVFTLHYLLINSSNANTEND